jgi:O-antigen chain-terminating methyltransferase
MFSIDDPEISAAELTRRARQEAEHRAMRSGMPLETTPEPDSASAQGWAAVHRAIASAEHHAVVGETLPAMGTMRGLARKIAEPIARLILRAAQLVTREQTSFNIRAIAALRALADALNTDQRAVENRLMRAVHGTEHALAKLTAELAGVGSQVRTLGQGAEAQTARTDSIEHALWAWRQEHVARFETLERTMTEERAGLRSELLLQERQIRLIAEQGHGQAAGASSGRHEPEELDRLLDTFYARFEDRFRGTREEIKTRAAYCLAIVREAGAGTAERPIVDLGCGRGEWLDLLAEQGLTARGVDSNLAMVAENRERGRDVVEAEALTYLRGLPDRSCGAVTALHLVEHLPFPTVIAIVDEIARVLQSSGVAILETPNPQNLLVGACTFYIDPTHRRPLHPETMRFLAEARGLTRVEIRYLHPMEGPGLPEDEHGLASRLNEYFHGPRDFAVLGYRA